MDSESYIALYSLVDDLILATMGCSSDAVYAIPESKFALIEVISSKEGISTRSVDGIKGSIIFMGDVIKKMEEIRGIARDIRKQIDHSFPQFKVDE